MVYHASLASIAAYNSSACILLHQDDSKLWDQFRVCRPRGDGRILETSQFLGDNVGLRPPAFIFVRKSSVRNDRVERLPALCRALERRSSLDKWTEDGPPSSGRWDKVKSRYSSIRQWKPDRPASKVPEEIENLEEKSSRGDLPVHDVREEESGEFDKLIRSSGRILVSEAKKRANLMTDYLKHLDVKKFISTVRDPASYPVSLSTGTVFAGFGAFLLFAIVVDAVIWSTSKKLSTKIVQLSSDSTQGGGESRSRSPSGLSLLVERDLRRKESVEWVNMVIGKLWNLYRRGLEKWLVGLLQPIIDDLEKPEYVKKVEVKQFFMGDEPLTVRTVERRTSRRADDLQYHIGVRYTGGARLLLFITLKWGFIPITIPVGVRGLDVDAEVWVKFRMLPSDPWVGQVTWAFVTLPKIKLDLAPFRLVNLMAIPYLSIFLSKLLTEDLPMLFVRPNKNIVDLVQGRVVGPVSKDFKDGVMLDGSRSFSGELSVTLMEGTRIPYIPYLKTDPYVIFALGEQVMRSKKNSQTSIVGAPGAPVWNQDFKLLVVDQKKQHLSLTLHDTIGFTSYQVSSGEIDLRTLQDTVPVDRKLTLKSGWGPFPKRFAGELSLRLTFKAYIFEDDEVDETGGELTTKGFSLVSIPGVTEQVQEVASFFKEETGKVAGIFQGKDLANGMVSSPLKVSSGKANENPFLIIGSEIVDEKEKSKGETRVDSGTPAVVSTAKRSSKVVAEVEPKSGSQESSISDGSGGQVPVSEAGRQSEKFLDQLKGVRDSQVLLWLTVATAMVWIVAADLNLSNLFNP